MSGHIIPRKTYFTIFGILMVLLVLTIVLAEIDMGPFNIVIAMAIAVTKALLVLLYFMHVRYSSKLTWVFASAGVFWLIIMIGITFSDYISRGWVPFSINR